MSARNLGGTVSAVYFMPWYVSCKTRLVRLIVTTKLRGNMEKCQIQVDITRRQASNTDLGARGAREKRRLSLPVFRAAPIYFSRRFSFARATD